MSWDWEKLKRQKQRGEFDKSPDKSKPKKKFEIPEWAFVVSYVIVAVMLGIAFWFPARWLHYKFAYENKVEQQIIEMINPEALKEKYRK